MNLLDWVFIIIIAISAVYGLFKGLIKEVVSILALVIGLVGSSRLYGMLSPVLKDFGLTDQISNVLSFLVLFLAIFVAIVLIGKLIHRFVHAILLGWVNRLGGAGFGFLRGVVVSSIIVIVLTITLSEKAQILAQSRITPHIMSISKVLVSLVPEDLQRRFMEQERKLREFWERKFKPQKMEANNGLIEPTKDLPRLPGGRRLS